MALEQWEIRGEVCRMYEDVGLDLLLPPGGIGIAKAHGARYRLDLQLALELKRRSCLVENDDGSHTILLASELSPVARAWKATHEVWEFRLGPLPRLQGRLPYRLHDLEWQVDQLVVETLVPELALRQTHRDLGLDLPGLAEHFGVSQKILALRLGEALGMPIALYQAGDKRRARSSVAYRGPYAIAPPNELAKVIAAGGARGMQVFWLSDRVGTALVVGEAL